MRTQSEWSCSICGNYTNYKAHIIKEMMFGLHHEFEYIECDYCQCLSLKSVPEDLTAYYPSDYYSFSDQPISSKQNNELVRLRNQYLAFGTPWIGKMLFNLFPKRELAWLPLIGLKKNTCILDVGCGSGNLLYFLKDQGMNNLTGIDPFLKNDRIASKAFTISKKDIFSISGIWEIILFHHAFEHMSDPKNVLAKTASMLSIGGQCIIAIPTVSGDAWEKYERNWVQLDAPRHLFLYSIESIEILAKQTGFSITKVLYNSTGFQFWGSEQNIRGIPLIDPASGTIAARKGLFSKKTLRNFEKMAIQLNKKSRGDQVVIFLKKTAA